MIRYDKGWWGLKTFTKMYGSAFPKALPFSVCSAFLAGVLAYFFGQELDDAFIHPYPFQTFAFVAGFMVVFRYWEGRTNLQLMTSKLTDAVVLALTFDREAVPKMNATEDQVKEHQWFRDTLIHLCSLLHAVALATLRTDYNMENIVAHDSLAHAPRANIRGALRDLEQYPEEHMDMGSRINGVHSSSQTTRSRKNKKGGRRSNESSPAVRPMGGNTGKLQLLDDDDDPELHLPDIQKHSQHAYETAGLRSILDYFILPTGAEHATKIYSIMKLPVVGGMTQAEGVALGAFVTSGDQCLAVPDLNLGIHGVLLDNGMYAPAPTERVHTLLSWLQQFIIERIHAGGVKASPPIQARIHSTLTDCMLGFEQCKKLVDTPFPFPWAQAVNIVLLMFAIGAPVVIVAHTTSVIAAVLITFAAVQTHIMLNEVARDIEDPYHYDPNELPLPQMQYKLNERLIAVSHSRRPVAFTDVGELTGPGNTILLRESPGPMRQLVAPPTSALAPPQRPTVPPAGLQKALGAPQGNQGQPTQDSQPRGGNSSGRTTSLAQTASHATSASRGGGRRGIAESVSVADMPSAGPGAVSAATLPSSSALAPPTGGGTGLSSSLTTGSRPVLNKGDATNMSSSSTPSMSFPPSQAAHMDAHPFAPSSYLTSGLPSAGPPESEGPDTQADEPLPPHPSQPTFSYGFAQNNIQDGSETSSLAHQGNYLQSGDDLVPDTASTARCDRPVPASQVDLQQYSSTAPVPAAAQFHNARWGPRAPPSTTAGSVARSTRGAGPPTSSRRPLSGELEGSESVWSSECPDQGNRMLHISGRADDKANGWPYNTRRW